MSQPANGVACGILSLFFGALTMLYWAFLIWIPIACFLAYPPLAIFPVGLALFIYVFNRK